MKTVITAFLFEFLLDIVVGTDVAIIIKSKSICVDKLIGESIGDLYFQPIVQLQECGGEGEAVGFCQQSAKHMTIEVNLTAVAHTA